MTKRLFLLVALFSISLAPINAQPFAYMTATFFSEGYVDEPSILVLDLATKKIVATIHAPGKPAPNNPLLYNYMNPIRIVFTPDGSRAVATASGMDYYDSYISPSESLLVVDMATNQIVKKVSLGGDGCHEVVISSDSQYAYTACEYSGTVEIINLNNGTITKSIDVRGRPTSLAIMSDGSRLYVGGCGFMAQSFCVINTATNTIAATLDFNSKKIVFAPDGSRAYLLLGNGNVSVLNAATNAQIATISLYQWDWANDMIITPDGKYLYAMGVFGVTVTDTVSNKVLKQISIPESIVGGTLAISPDGKYVYVPDNSQIWVINTGTNTLADKISLSAQVGIRFIAITSGPKPKPTFSLAGVLNAASFQGGSVAPGEVVTIFGSAIGPPTLATMRLTPDGLVDNFLADTRVLFDDIPAPIIYVSQNQDSVIVPYSVMNKYSVQVKVEYKGVRSEPITFQVASVAPGIFTLNSSGKGQAAVLNEDVTINSSENPAPRDSVVVLYATGEGPTNPAGMDGKVANFEFPKPLLPVWVKIGGILAEVLYAGAAPGLVAGVMQVNVRIPNNISPGNATPVTLTVGSIGSQQGVTVAIR